MIDEAMALEAALEASWLNGFVAGFVHEGLIILHGQGTEHPVRVTGRRDHDAPLRTVALREFFPRGNEFVP